MQLWLFRETPRHSQIDRLTGSIVATKSVQAKTETISGALCFINVLGDGHTFSRCPSRHIIATRLLNQWGYGLYLVVPSHKVIVGRAIKRQLVGLESAPR